MCYNILCQSVLHLVPGYLFVSPLGNSDWQERATRTKGGYSFYNYGVFASPGYTITKAGKLEAKEELTDLLKLRDTAALKRQPVLNQRPFVWRGISVKRDKQLAGYGLVQAIAPSVSSVVKLVN